MRENRDIFAWKPSDIPGVPRKLAEHRLNVDPSDMTPLKKPTIDAYPLLKFQSAKDTKEVEFMPGDSSKMFTIGADMDPK
jgi:hypothetical protein